MTLIELFLASTGFILHYRDQLVKALLLPFLIYVCLDVMAFFMTGGLFDLAYFIASLMLESIFAITTHRILLLGPDAVPEWGFRKWTSRETMFALNMIFMGLLMLPFLFLALIPIVGWGLAALAFVFLFPRLSLIFPAIAIEEEFSFKSSWALSQNYHKLMLFAVVLMPLIVIIPILLVGLLPNTSIITSILSTLTIVLTVASLSVAYKHISNETGKDKGDEEICD